ncbi:UDP-N-acetylmuramate--L-alanine ligase [Paralimibaculum aggregatum]|uniref:UDP-N-acetylmuramate--L-alanine ligase n=1 Tax=Paralimibaculum aggregatum TaxID=3036245 RepID=A0ABQ6LIU4_9RHOB|nr:UDP-N-acetylmuramate--L-alanine ligase [Limibaculum sp. NKW23]GMG82346.1 UDP-N-acetylmuramate--L-alanine ligase [Limibaculum sp. NKW23]
MNPPTALPLDIGPIHFIGIGGIGMSGIAEVLLNMGYQVQGSDIRESPIVARLRNLGARIAVGHAAENVEGAGVCVISTAIRPDNPELAAARERSLPVVRRAEMLAELMRLRWNVAVAGTHGKTTTTSMVSALLDAGGEDPTVINGGIIQSYGSNARLGDGRWMVVEADESDGTFVKLPATIAIVTNIDPEHMDHYGTVEALREGFDAFVSNIPFYGALIACMDHPEVQSLIGRVTDRRVVTYGLSRQADIRAENLGHEGGRMRFDLVLRGPEGDERHPGLSLPMPGEHNVCNALAAIAAARELQIGMDEIRAGLEGFKGVKRRFTLVGSWQGARIIDDYGHHPVEIAAVLKAARASVAESGGRVIAIHQPHRYSRLHDLFEEFCAAFNDADVVAITDVFAAGEAPIEGVSRDALVGGLRAHGHRRAHALRAPEGLAAWVAAEARPGDLVICLGAGSISAWANALPEELARLGGGDAPRAAQG